MELDSRFRLKYGRNWERDKRIIKKLRTYDRAGIFLGSAYCLRRGRKGETEKGLTDVPCTVLPFMLPVLKISLFLDPNAAKILYPISEFLNPNAAKILDPVLSSLTTDKLRDR